MAAAVVVVVVVLAVTVAMVVAVVFVVVVVVVAVAELYPDERTVTTFSKANKQPPWTALHRTNSVALRTKVALSTATPPP